MKRDANPPSPAIIGTRRGKGGTMKSQHYLSHHSLDHYFILFLLITTGLLAFVKTTHPEKQLQIAATTAGFYLVWNVLHHYRKNHLHWKIVLEYSAFAVIGFAMLWLILTLVS